MERKQNMIRIICPKDGFRRAGIAHPQGATDYPDKAFTSEQLKALKAEPMLAVEIVPGDIKKSGKKEEVKE
jgi:hypothetical protein